MRNLKKVLATGLAVLTFVAMSMTTLAAGNINVNEQKVLDAAYAVAQTHEVSQSRTFQYYYGAAKNFLLAEDLTADECSTLVAAVNNAAKEIPAELKGSAMFAEWARDGRLESIASKVESILISGAKAAGIDISVSGDKYYIKYNGKIYGESGDAVKQTGMDVNTTVVVIAALGAVLAVCGVAAKKRGMFVSDHA